MIKQSQTNERTNERTNEWTTGRPWPRDANGGAEHITFSVARPVYVTGMTLYETNHPGAVTEIFGRRNQNTPWISIWTGAVSPPAGTNARDPTTVWGWLG